MTVNVDFTGIAQSVVNALLEGVKALSGQAANQTTDLLHQALQWFSLSGLNFMVGTPIALITAGADIFAPTAIRPVLQDATDLAFLLAGISYVGHHWLGWPGLGETVSRIVVTIVMVGSSFRLLDLSMSAINGMTAHLASRPPTLPDLNNVPPMIAFGGAVIWLILAVRLAVQMAKRVVWLAILYRLAPIALATNLHASSGWIASTWARLWVGWLVGIVGVVVCFVVSIDVISAVGLPAGYLFSLASLLVAYDVVRILAPKEGMGSIGLSAGVGPLRVSL